MAPSSAVTPRLSPVALLIGENPEVESALAGLLNPEGWRMQKASGTDEAIALVKSTPFDMVITGRHTSGHDHVAFLRRIRGVRPHTRVIILANKGFRRRRRINARIRLRIPFQIILYAGVARGCTHGSGLTGLG